MNKELDINEIKIALKQYMKAKGYKKSSLSKKCSIEYSLLDLFLNEKLTMKKDIANAIIHIILEEEKLTREELLAYAN